MGSGAHEWNRTIDLLLTKEVLYRLSYVSRFSKQVVHCNAMVERETGIEPALVAWKATVLPLNYSRAVRNSCRVRRDWWREVDDSALARLALRAVPFGTFRNTLRAFL